MNLKWLLVGWLSSSAVLLGWLWWGYYNYQLGLRRGRELGTMETLLRLSQDDPELRALVLEECERLGEVERLERLYRRGQ